MVDNEGDRLAADGIPIEIAGRTLHARFTNRSLLAMEKRYGSLPKVGAVLQRLGSGPSAEDEQDVPLYETAFYFLGLALRHEEGITEDWLIDNVDTTRVLQYAEIAFKALMQAMPGAPASDDGANPTQPSGTTGGPKKPFPGGDSSGSPSLDAALPAESSGTA